MKNFEILAPAGAEEQLKAAVRQGTEYEEAVKTGQMNDQMAVELFIIQNSKSSK